MPGNLASHPQGIVLHDIGTGIVVYRASRLEALLDPLVALLDSNPPDAVLAPQTIIAAHPGMKQWLLGALARKRGVGGIAANLDIVLPSAWLDRLAQDVLGENAVALRAYQRNFLRWRIHDLLDDLEDGQIDAYLRGSDVARRRFQLADRLARIYTQYLVYRPDWLQAWFAGRDPTGDAGFLAPLWKRLRTQIGQAHRGEMLSRLIGKLDDATRMEQANEPLHVFGTSHLAPSELAVLRAVARHRLVVLYVPDPCREFWAGMRNDRRALLDLVKQGVDATATETAFLEQGHPLLASWGRMGQHFMLALDDSDAALDERHYRDRREAQIDPTNRLERLQESIRRADPGVIASGSELRSDRSLRVHACHTRLRELEVLRDALLRELSEHPDLKPSDIVVMAPNIQAYLPLLPAVFGEAGVHAGSLPYHIADVAIARAHPLFDAFVRLLDLPRSRLTAPEVIDLLSVPQIAGRFALSAGDVDTLSSWLRNARVRWALDAPFRARFDVPEIPEHTFAWGIDRMLAGYAMGDADDGALQWVLLPDGSEIAPLGGIAGTQAAALGALDGALIELARWCELGAHSQRASAWAARIEHLFDDIFRIDPTDRDAVEARTALLRFIRTIAGEPAENGLDPDLDFNVVRDLLLAQIAATPERQRFLMGGATFCGMVPQRAIPFRVVAVLGLNDGEFPRADSDGGIDIMLKHPRMGDRDVRSDDRYLFLQTVMSARDALHLSWIGEGVRDGKPRNPAAPLAELLAALDASAGLQVGDDVDADNPEQCRRRPWLVRHPLQPFDARYFDGSDVALFSYRKDFAEMDLGAACSKVQRMHRGVERAQVAQASFAANATILLPDVLAYFKDPARQTFTQRMKLRLDALDDNSLQDSEALDAKVDAIEGVARRLFLDCIALADRTIPDRPPAWLRLTGLLPPGRSGDEAWEAESGKVQSLLDATRGHPLFANGVPQRAVIASMHQVGDDVIEGDLRRAFATSHSHWIFDAFPGKKESDLDFKHRIGLFIEWALLRLNDTRGDRSAQLCIACGDAKHEWQDAINGWDAAFIAAIRNNDRIASDAMLADLRRRLIALLDHYRAAQNEPQSYFPKTSWIAATKPGDIAKTWQGAYNSTGEREYAPGYARLLAGDIDFASNESVAELTDIARQLHDLITPLAIGATST